MKKNRFVMSLASLAAACLLLPATSRAEEAKATIFKACKQCHTAEENGLRGTLSSVSMKAETIKLDVGPKATWLVHFDDDTKLVGAEALDKIETGKEILIRYEKEDGRLLAVSVYVKQPAKIEPGMVMKVDELAELVAAGPEKGNFALIDARPGKKWHEGHIAGSISIYDAEFDDNIAKLPKDKDTLLIFYCGGPT